MFDITIIGAGIIGTMLAKDLSKYACKVALIEAENDIANGATNANSAIIHTGYDPEDCSLKATLNVRGAKMYEQLCKDLGCHYKVVGAFVVATTAEEENHLKVLANRADKRNIPYRWLSGEQARNVESNLSDSITKVLDFYTTAIIYPWEVALSCAQVAFQNDVAVYLNNEVIGIQKEPEYYVIQTNKKKIHTKVIVNAAGIYADKIDAMLPHEHTFTIHPKKGEYYVLDNDEQYVKHVVFPVPSSKGKGVLAVPTVYGNTLLGPTAEENNADNGTSKEGLRYIQENLVKTMKNIPYNKVIRTFAGIRPSSTSKDFIIEEPEKNFINVASIESPGLASAPAISQYVIETFLSKDIQLIPKEHYTITRDKPIVIKDCNQKEKQSIIAQNPLYGKIICRCENISEQEIIDSIHAPLGATTIKQVKKRVRCGMGRCQGGFCEPLIMQILAREMHVDPKDILLDNVGSNILTGENR